MSKEDLINKHLDGVPDEEMLELKEEGFSRARPNRLAKRVFQLDEDVSLYFKTTKEINDALRLVIQLNKVVSRK